MKAAAQRLGYTYKFLGRHALQSRSAVYDFCLAQVRGTRRRLFA